MTDTLRMAELAGALARAADTGTGLPPDTALRTCLLALGIARRMDATDDDLRDLYYSALLRHAGCSASSHEEMQFAGDDLDMRNTLGLADAAKVSDVLPRVIKRLNRGKGVFTRVRWIASFMANGQKATPEAFRGRCEVATRFAIRLALGPRVERALAETYERFDGKGAPAHRKGDELSTASRMLAVAEVAASYYAVGGVAAARDVVATRSGGQLDPAYAEVFLAAADELVAPLAAPALWQPVLDAEPLPRLQIGPAKLRAVAELMADYADLKSTWTLGHSRGVAERARRAGESLGLPADELATLELAALLHDLGRVAISNAIWDKPGPLDKGERELVRAHTHHTERVLEQIGGPIAAAARLASHAHERVDASGYHRGVGGGGLTTAARLLAAADITQALGEARPYRAAMSSQQIVDTMKSAVRHGQLDARAVDAVLAAAGTPVHTRTEYPAGLSEREVEVLQHVARGLTDKEIAQKLGISHRTVHHHNQHAFTKIGVSTRAAAALFLIENGLL